MSPSLENRERDFVHRVWQISKHVLKFRFPGAHQIRWEGMVSGLQYCVTNSRRVHGSQFFFNLKDPFTYIIWYSLFSLFLAIDRFSLRDRGVVSPHIIVQVLLATLINEFKIKSSISMKAFISLFSESS